jgi:hypothetical protein
LLCSRDGEWVFHVQHVAELQIAGSEGIARFGSGQGAEVRFSQL